MRQSRENDLTDIPNLIRDLNAMVDLPSNDFNHNDIITLKDRADFLLLSYVIRWHLTPGAGWISNRV